METKSLHTYLIVNVFQGRPCSQDAISVNNYHIDLQCTRLTELGLQLADGSLEPIDIPSMAGPGW
jgi:hypothetical protein